MHPCELPAVLVVEDGDEYARFVEGFLGDACDVHHAHSATEALAALRSHPVEALLLDLRFERASPDKLLGDVAATARRLFAGDRARAIAYLKDQQGTLILAELRRAGHQQPAVFVHDFPDSRLSNLRKLYGEVRAIDTFDAELLARALGVKR